MKAASASRLAMGVASVMIAHQVAAKAVRDASFLGAWPVSALPVIVIVAAAIVVAAVPIYSAWLGRFGARGVVATGFFVSAIAHVLEWRWSGTSPWIAATIYLHIACLGGLLLSGFWSVISELFDPGAAKANFGRIAAAGTVGGLAGGLAVERIAASRPEADALLLLACLHFFSAVGVLMLVRRAPARTADAGMAAAKGVFDFASLFRIPHLKTLGLIVMLGTAGAAIADYLLKVAAVGQFGTGPRLLQFFATFYLLVQLATVIAQFWVGAGIRRFGLGRTISALPAGVGGTAALGLLYPGFPLFVAVRGVESVLRGSLFRSAYELIFVPMDPAEKHRTKTFLDVTCDRMGDAVGASIVQLVLVTSASYLSAELLAAVIGLAGWSLWLASRLDAVYLGVVERRLTTHGAPEPIVVGSETGWTVISLPSAERHNRTIVDAPVPRPAAETDPTLRRLADLRSGDRARVERALGRLTQPDAVEFAQIVQLLAWDDMVPTARRVLEGAADAHIGLLIDALLNQDTDFAIRRRLPRILGVLVDTRVVEGLIRGLDDPRFEVRYQCSRALRRLLSKHPGLSVDGERLIAVVERELSVAPQIWHGHQLIDRVEREDETTDALISERGQRNLEHVFSLLSVVLPPEPLTVALRGIQSEDAAFRGVAIEYLETVLPQSIWARLWLLFDPVASPRTARGTPEETLDRLRRSVEMKIERQD